MEFTIVFLTFPETFGLALEEVSAVLDDDKFFSFRHPIRRPATVGSVEEEQAQLETVSVKTG